jgi:transposase InsO family protein
MCLIFGYSKQAYYKQLYQNANKAVKEEVIVGLIEKKREIWKRGSGRNLHQSLKKEFKEHQIKLGRDKFFDMLRQNGLLIKPKRIRAKTTCSYHHFNKYKNLMEGHIPKRCNEVWVSDITYIWLKEQDKFCYLNLITDLYSRKIVGHCVYENLSVKGSIIALQQALKQRSDKTLPLIHHSDRGVQYCCHAYVTMLQKNKVQISMTQSGDPLENAVAERINRTIKEEFTDDREMHFSNIELAKISVKKIIQFYNEKRPHRSINWHTPNEAHKIIGSIKRVWKSYYRQSIQRGDLVKA